MKPIIPYNKIIRLAIITAVLFGLFGATPALEFARKDFGRIEMTFLFICFITLILWTINIGLLWLEQNFIRFKYDWIRYLLSIIFSVIIIFLLFKIFLSKGIPPAKLRSEIHRFPPMEFPKHIVFLPIIQVQSINIIILVLLELVLLRNTKLQIENENNQLRLANLEAKHGQLKQQLQPHFLFNSLNTLKTLIKKSPERAEDYLKKLSDLLRFAINSSSRDLVSLEKELELVTYYLQMQKVRFGNALSFTISIPSSLQLTGEVPVYSLQLLVENAIKHNILTIEDPLHIYISANEENKTLTVSNNLQPKPVMDEAIGVGLVNLSERYKLLGNYEVDFKNKGTQFTVTIKVLENESSNNRR